MDLNGTVTHRNLKEAFARESMANRRYLYFAETADVDGHPGVAAAFREVAESETGHANGHLDYLADVGDPATDEPMGDTMANLATALASELHDAEEMYTAMAASARHEGFGEIADWFESLAAVEAAHAQRFTKLLDGLA